MRTMFVATVEVVARNLAGDDEAALAPLADFSPVLRASSSGRLQIQLLIPATGVSGACAKAEAIARAVTGADPIGCEVISQQEHHARHVAEHGEAPWT